MTVFRFSNSLCVLFVLPLLAWPLLSKARRSDDLVPEKINLALRRTADGLLRISGDSTSRIPAVEHTAAAVWRVRLEQPFDYEQLPALLQASLDLYGVRQVYSVVVRGCDSGIIDIGYHQFDFSTQDKVPCTGRTLPAGCHFIEVTFLQRGVNSIFEAGNSLLLILLGGVASWWWFARRRKVVPAMSELEEEPEWLEFGQSRLDVSGQILVCSGIRQPLTFRETKLLRLFATHPDRLLERSLILGQVWEDEGIQVGRSVDVFVSRLRKKLVADPSVGISVVHGVGYRLETGKHSSLSDVSISRKGRSRA